MPTDQTSQQRVSANPCRIENTESIARKKCQRWLSPRDVFLYTVWWKSIHGDFWANGWSVTCCDSFGFFWGSRRGQTHWQILIFNGWLEAHLCAITHILKFNIRGIAQRYALWGLKKLNIYTSYRTVKIWPKIVNCSLPVMVYVSRFLWLYDYIWLEINQRRRRMKFLVNMKLRVGNFKFRLCGNFRPIHPDRGLLINFPTSSSTWHTAKLETHNLVCSMQRGSISACLWVKSDPCLNFGTRMYANWLYIFGQRIRNYPRWGVAWSWSSYQFGSLYVFRSE